MVVRWGHMFPLQPPVELKDMVVFPNIGLALFDLLFPMVVLIPMAGTVLFLFL